MKGLAELRNRWAHFKVQDVYLPEPQAVMTELYGNDILQGRVVDITDSGAQGRAFVVVEVEGIKHPVVVPMERVLGVL